MDLIDSNEAMLVLNNLPNVQILNGRSTKDDDDEDEEEEERESNEEIGKHRNNHFFPQMEEIQEDKNMENNSNYVSNENNNSNEIGLNMKNKINGNSNAKNNNEKQKINIPKLNINEVKEKEKDENLPVLNDKIISNNSNKNLLPINNSNNIEQNIKRESNFDSLNVNNNTNKSNFLIDITNDELSLLKEEKYDKNYDFISFLKEYFSIFHYEEKDNGNKIINDYLDKLKEIDNQKENIPNYFYFYLILNKKMSLLKSFFDELFPYILNKCPELNKNNILIKMNNEVLNSIQVLKELFRNLHTHIELYNNKKDSNLSKINNNTNDNNLNEVLKEKNNIISSLESQRDTLFKTLNQDKVTYEKRIETLEKENKIMTQKLLNQANLLMNSSSIDYNSKVTPTNKAQKPNAYGLKKINFRNNSQSPIKRDNTKFENYNKQNKHKRNHESNITFNKSRSPMKSFDNTLTIDNNNNTINFYLNTINNYNNINISKNQFISLKTLKDFMNELYLSKANYDMKCIELKLPKETLEEHMYTFLNKKYGLKNLIIEWARNIINGIKFYSKKDSFVLLFGKIMRNEQEEDARFIIQKVSESIEELLLYYIKRQFPLKSVNQINYLFENKKNSELFEEEWKGIIFSIYEKREAEEIEKKIENFINKENEKKKLEMFKKYKESRLNNKNNNFLNSSINHNNNINSNKSYYFNTINSINNGINNSSTSPKNLVSMNPITSPTNMKLSRLEKYNMLLYPEDKNIFYKDFIKIVLDNHIRFRDKQLKNFVDLFRSVDTNKDGIISEEEFSELIQKMNIFKEDILENKIFQFLEKIDPFDNQKITFSECVSFFSGEIYIDNDINGNEKEISILEKICFNGEENKNGNNGDELNENEQIENNVNVNNNNNSINNNSINKPENNNEETGIIDK